jgi:hypothetical protein
VDAQPFSYLERTYYRYQYNYVSPTCLSTWWCYLIVGDPTAQADAQPVYGQYTMFAFEDADSGDIYIGREAGSRLLSFAIKSTAKYALESGEFVVFDNVDEFTVLRSSKRSLSRPHNNFTALNRRHSSSALAITRCNASRSMDVSVCCRKQSR